MGIYNFDTVPSRLRHHSIKWKECEADPHLIPAWIADMDFVAFPEMTQAIHDYADQLVYGYTYPCNGLYKSILDWEESQHGYVFDKEAIVLMEGVVPAISTAIQALTKEGDAILINTPVYPPFARNVLLNKRKLVRNSLKEEDGLFQIDFEQLEKDLVAHHVKMYILCNPHNPGGRVWEKDVLEKIGRLCQKHGVLVVSDEIHQDLALFGHKHHSFNTVSPNFKEFSIVLTSATKTFNIAGTKNSYAIIENPALRTAYEEQRLANNQHEISSLGLIATKTAYRHGHAWLQELKEVLEGNINYAVDYLNQHAPRLKVMKPQGTYLLWLDFSDYGLSDDQLFDLLKQEAGIILNRGTDFGQEGKYHARLNVAAPLARVIEICQRLADALPG